MRFVRLLYGVKFVIPVFVIEISNLVQLAPQLQFSWLLLLLLKTSSSCLPVVLCILDWTVVGLVARLVDQSWMVGRRWMKHYSMLALLIAIGIFTRLFEIQWNTHKWITLGT